MPYKSKPEIAIGKEEAEEMIRSSHFSKAQMRMIMQDERGEVVEEKVPKKKVKKVLSGLKTKKALRNKIGGK